MSQLVKYFSKIKNNKLDNLIDEKREIHCVNDESFAFFVYYQYIKNPSQMVIVVPNLLACQKLSEKLSSMLPNLVYSYCVDEVIKFTSLATSNEMSAQRLFILNLILENKPVIIVTHTMAFKRITPSRYVFEDSFLNIKVDQEASISDMVMSLTKLGYKNVYKVTQPFEYSTRGGVIDIFSVNYDNPIRIEFFDTIVDSIRFFDCESQRTISTTNEIKVIPATEFLINSLDEGLENIRSFAEKRIDLSPANLELDSHVSEDLEHLSLYDFSETLFKYYSFFNTYSNLSTYITNRQVFVLNEKLIHENEDFITNEMNEDMINSFNEGISLKELFMFDRFNNVIDGLKQVTYVSSDVTNTTVDLDYVKVDTFDFNYENLYKELIEYKSRHYTIYIGLDSLIHYQSIKQYFEQQNISYNEVDENSNLKVGINLSHEDLNIGLDLEEFKLYIIGENEIFKKRFKTSISQFSRYKNAITISSVNDLEVGDYLVHDTHGIGIYQGIETLLNNGVHRDYLKISYKGGSELFLPLEQFKLVRKYVSKEGVVPKINKLGSTEWENTKKRIKERVNEIAEKLVELYSLRAEKEGFSFAKDDDLQLAFESDFGHELTKDQKTVLKEIKEDMERPYIMDRLLVGDVGFGKTEIAFIAAFKAINSGKQVALLCPTTLLARQHYLTAIDRFRNYGIRIRLLSRLVSESETNLILKGLKSKEVDFVIGTHRLLSSDVSFGDLGLLIVDEEHKFGVEHKEKIKEIKKNVDVLTLSATPIPRTLQMALTGVRGFSTINTPIDNRMPVQTYVIKKDKHAIKDIIERELARGGQIYYLCNKIDRLSSIAREIQDMVKSARIAIAHGKLPVEQMEDIMQSFINNDYNILLCTTIIENGIDIPNVNTIIVENADCFGLSQLYQIKGRVGRSDRLAYAYLMYSGHKELSEIATKRLQTIKEFTALGSGYKVAMRDLITRGAGDLLGPEQSGFIETVGIDMYIEMLQDSIAKKKALAENQEIKEEKIVPNKMLNIDAYIPNQYFNNDFEKIDLYKKIDKVKTIDELQALKDEMIDETGKLPDSINMLFEKRSIDIFESKGIIESYTEYDNYILIKLSKDFMNIRGIGIPLFELACKISNTISLKFKVDHIECHVLKKDGWLYIVSEFVSKLSMLKSQYEEGKIQ